MNFLQYVKVHRPEAQPQPEETSQSGDPITVATHEVISELSFDAQNLTELQKEIVLAQLRNRQIDISLEQLMEVL